MVDYKPHGYGGKSHVKGWWPETASQIVRSMPSGGSVISSFVHSPQSRTKDGWPAPLFPDSSIPRKDKATPACPCPPFWLGIVPIPRINRGQSPPPSEVAVLSLMGVRFDDRVRFPNDVKVLQIIQ